MSSLGSQKSLEWTLRHDRRLRKSRRIAVFRRDKPRGEAELANVMQKDGFTQRALGLPRQGLPLTVELGVQKSTPVLLERSPLWVVNRRLSSANGFRG